jgi:hypothetical protein
MHISYAISLAIFTLLCVYNLYKKQKIYNLIFLLIGILIGYSPIILFDIRHNFYNTGTMLTFFVESFSSKNTGFSFTSYYFIYLLIPLYIFISILLRKLFSTKQIIIFLLLYIAISYSSWHLSDVYPPGMPKGTNLNTVKYISSVITNDVSGEFEVAAIVDGETRAQNLRYILEFVNNKTPMPSNKYPEATVLYVVSYLDQDPLTKSVWELDSIKPASVTNIWRINSLIKLTKLEKRNDK